MTRDDQRGRVASLPELDGNGKDFISTSDLKKKEKIVLFPMSWFRVASQL